MGKPPRPTASLGHTFSLEEGLEGAAWDPGDKGGWSGHVALGPGVQAALPPGLPAREGSW